MFKVKHKRTGEILQVYGVYKARDSWMKVFFLMHNGKDWCYYPSDNFIPVE